MNQFEDALKNDNFVCSACTKCGHLVWPPNDICNKCFGDVTWRVMSRNARIIEISSVEGKYFCIAEFEGGIRVFGTISGKSVPNIGQNLVLEKCDYDKTPKFIFGIR